MIIFMGSCDYLHGVMGLSSWGHVIIFMGSCDYLHGSCDYLHGVM